jgi:hypothetical protein
VITLRCGRRCRRLWSLHFLWHGADALALAGAELIAQCYRMADPRHRQSRGLEQELFGVNTIFIDEANVTSAPLGDPPSDATNQSCRLLRGIADIETRRNWCASFR